MNDNFEKLKVHADARWEALVNGNKPWIRIGSALCGEAAGSKQVFQKIKEYLEHKGIEAIISKVGCMGMCFAEPMLDITAPGMPRTIYGSINPDTVSQIVDQHLIKEKPIDNLVLGILGDDESSTLPSLMHHPMMKDQVRIALRNVGNVDPAEINDYIANDGYKALHKALTSMSSQEVLDEVSNSGLKGRGGAAFSTGTKWSFLANSDAPIKYILVNCEEGDPGAFNDKGILESDPHSLLEGTILAGYATGATMGYVFVRQGHSGPIDRIWNAIYQAREMGILGKNIFNSSFDFDVEVSLTGDSYVAGEETALMESMEGKRAMPRYRPPFPAQVGLFGKPSNINNVKTLSYVPQIILNGSDWFANIGTDGSKGTAIICLSGDLVYTGMIEVPLGTSLEKVIYDTSGGVPGGGEVKLLQTGGPLGGVLSGKALDISLDFESMAKAGAILGSGGIIAASNSVCVVNLTRNIIAFCQYESCGKCFPCRTGMSHLLEILERICKFKGKDDDLDLLSKVGNNMQAGSLCGHGQLGFNPVSSAFRYFPEEFDQHIRDKTCVTGDCYETWYTPARTRR